MIGTRKELPDISAAVETFVKDVFDGYRMEKGGSEFILDCPFCGKKRLYIRKKTGLWICFKCGEKGGFAWLVKQIGKDDPTFDTSVYLSGLTEARRADLEHLSLLSWAARGHKLPEASPPPARFVPAPVGTIPCWRPHESAFADAKRAKGLAYLLRRGLTGDQAEQYGVHVGISGRYQFRVVVPVVSPETGEPAGWVARAYRPGIEPKVLNTPSSEGLSIDDYLFNLDKSAGYYKDAVLVEGIFDAMRHGLNHLALLGKSLKTRQFMALRKAGFERVTVVLDKDAPRECRELARSLRMHVPEVRYLLLRDAKDPGEMTREQLREEIAAHSLPA